MNNLNLRPLFVLLLLLAACSDNSDKTVADNQSIASRPHIHTAFPIDTTYMPTGFYFLADSLQGIRMRLRGSDEVYTISKDAFASGKDIVDTKWETTSTKAGVSTELCMKFNYKGTNDLKGGMGNPMHPKIAVVVANQLLFVVDNSAKVTAGEMCVALIGFSKPEMKAIRLNVLNKK